MYAFVSYQTKDKAVAGRVKVILDAMKVQSFLAHEDIAVSEEWRIRILEEIARVDIFFALLSQNYFSSPWCSQEFGIAAFRNVTIVPLSLDDTVPLGFGSHIQSRKIREPRNLAADLIGGIVRRDRSQAIDMIIELIGESASFDRANENMTLLAPYLQHASRRQVLRLLQLALDNNQVLGAYEAKNHLQPLLGDKKLLVPLGLRRSLERVWDRQ